MTIVSCDVLVLDLTTIVLQLQLQRYMYVLLPLIYWVPLISNSTTVLVVVPCTVQRRVVLPVVVFAAVELTKVSTGPLGSMKKILRYDYEGLPESRNQLKRRELE